MTGPGGLDATPWRGGAPRERLLDSRGISSPNPQRQAMEETGSSQDQGVHLPGRASSPGHLSRKPCHSCG